MSDAPEVPAEGALQAGGRTLDLSALGERSERVDLGSPKARPRALFAEQAISAERDKRVLFPERDRFVTEWSYYPDDEDAGARSQGEENCHEARNGGNGPGVVEAA